MYAKLEKVTLDTIQRLLGSCEKNEPIEGTFYKRDDGLFNAELVQEPEPPNDS
jgi:hypothetical protein